MIVGLDKFMDEYYVRIKKIFLLVIALFSFLESIVVLFYIPEKIDAFFLFSYKESLFLLVANIAFFIFAILTLIYYRKLIEPFIPVKEESNPIEMTNGHIKISNVKRKKIRNQHPKAFKFFMLFCCCFFFILIIGAYNYMARQFTYDVLDRENGLFRTVIDTFGRIIVCLTMIIFLYTQWLNYYKNSQKQKYYIVIIALSAFGTINASLYYLGNFLYFPPISDLTLALLCASILIYSIYELITLRKINTIKKIKQDYSSPKR